MISSLEILISSLESSAEGANESLNSSLQISDVLEASVSNQKPIERPERFEAADLTHRLILRP